MSQDTECSLFLIKYIRFTHNILMLLTPTCPHCNLPFMLFSWSSRSTHPNSIALTAALPTLPTCQASLSFRRNPLKSRLWETFCKAFMQGTLQVWVHMGLILNTSTYVCVHKWGWCPEIVWLFLPFLSFIIMHCCTTQEPHLSCTPYLYTM